MGDLGFSGLIEVGTKLFIGDFAFSGLIEVGAKLFIEDLGFSGLIEVGVKLFIEDLGFSGLIEVGAKLFMGDLAFSGLIELRGKFLGGDFTFSGENDGRVNLLMGDLVFSGLTESAARFLVGDFKEAVVVLDGDCANSVVRGDCGVLFLFPQGSIPGVISDFKVSAVLFLGDFTGSSEDITLIFAIFRAGDFEGSDVNCVGDFESFRFRVSIVPSSFSSFRSGVATSTVMSSGSSLIIIGKGISLVAKP